MTLRPEYALGHSEFNAFLFAFVGEEKSGLELTVLSALSRLDIDPWAEAARLARLPREAATRALGTVIERLPEGRWSVADAQAIAARLVTALPAPGTAQADTQPAVAPAAGNARNAGAAPPRFWTWLVVLAILAAVIGALWNLQTEREVETGLSDARSGQEQLVGVA